MMLKVSLLGKELLHSCNNAEAKRYASEGNMSKILKCQVAYIGKFLGKEKRWTPHVKRQCYQMTLLSNGLLAYV